MSDYERDLDTIFFSPVLKREVFSPELSRAILMTGEFAQRSMPPPSIGEIEDELELNEVEPTTANKMLASRDIYRRSLNRAMSSVNFVLSCAFDQFGFSACEAEVAARANRDSCAEGHIRGILLDPEQRLESSKKHLYPLGSPDQIEIEVVHDRRDLVPLLSKMSAER